MTAFKTVLTSLLLSVTAVQREEVNCDFEVGQLCPGWEQVTSPQDDVDWSVWQERSNTSPASTKINGHYLQLESMTDSVNKTAIFGSPVLTSSSTDVTVDFWYAMNGHRLQQLSVEVKDTRITGQNVHVWTVATSATHTWTRVSARVVVVSPFRVIFKGCLAGPDGQIAVDDISISSSGHICDVNNPSADVNVTSPILLTSEDETLFGHLIAEDLPLVVATVSACVFCVGFFGLLIRCLCHRRAPFPSQMPNRGSDSKGENIYQLPDLPPIPDPHIYCEWVKRNDRNPDTVYCEPIRRADYNSYATII